VSYNKNVSEPFMYGVEYRGNYRIISRHIKELGFLSFKLVLFNIAVVDHVSIFRFKFKLT
jgi:hypothetical protein